MKRLNLLVVVALLVSLAMSGGLAQAGGPAAKATAHTQGTGAGASALAGKHLAAIPFNNPNYTYTKIVDSGTTAKYRQAGLRPQGDKIVAVKQTLSPITWEIVLLNLDGTGETMISPGDSGTGDIAQYTNPFWSDDGSKVGFAEVHNANPNKIIVYNMATATRSYLYAPAAPLDCANPDFIGNSTTKIVFWDYGVGGLVDLFTYDASTNTRTNITNTSDNNEYEPVSNLAGDIIVYWSGESAVEPVNTTHILKWNGSTWVKDTGFTPIPDTYWSYFTGRSGEKIATTVMSSKDVFVYTNNGTFDFDLTGPGYSGGAGQWTFVGSHPQGPRGEFVLTSNADNPVGRDIILALPVRPVWQVDDGFVSDVTCTASVRMCKTIQAAVDAASDYDIVTVAPGTYTEQVRISKPLTLRGSGASLTTIAAPAVLQVYDDRQAIVTIKGAGVAVDVSGFTVSGPNATATTFTGIWVRNGAYANIHDNTISNIRANPLDGNGGWGVWVGRQANTTSAMATIKNNVITGYGKGGIVLDNTGSYALIVANTITGVGPNAIVAANGIQISRGATGVVQGNVVSLNSYTAGGGWKAGGMITYQAGAGVLFRENESKNNDDGFIGADTAATTLLNNNFHNNGSGIVLESAGSSNTVIMSNKIESNAEGIRLADDMGTGNSAHYNSIVGNTAWGVQNDHVSNSFDASSNWWGSPAGPGGANNGVTGLVTTTPYAAAYVASLVASTHEIGDVATLDTKPTVNGLYGAQLRVSYDPGVLSWASGVRHDVSGKGWFWENVWNDFTAMSSPTGNRVAGTMQPPHVVGANLTGADSIATWNYTCASAGISGLTYESGSLGTVLSNKDFFEIPAALIGDSVTCLAATGSVNGTIQLQGRVQGATTPRGWNDAIVTFTCASGGCLGYGPYVFVTGVSGTYEMVKGGIPGAGMAAGTYNVTGTRHEYLSASKTGVVVTKDGTTVLTTPKLLGGDANNSGDVGIGDLSCIGGAFGGGPATCGGAGSSDINQDGITNILDLVAAGGNYGLSSSTW